jgi:hypothetical protein
MLASSWASEAGMVVRAANIVAVPVAARKAGTEVHQYASAIDFTHGCAAALTTHYPGLHQHLRSQLPLNLLLLILFVYCGYYLYNKL